MLFPLVQAELRLRVTGQAFTAEEDPVRLGLTAILAIVAAPAPAPVLIAIRGFSSTKG